MYGFPDKIKQSAAQVLIANQRVRERHNRPYISPQLIISPVEG